MCISSRDFLGNEVKGLSYILHQFILIQPLLYENKEIKEWISYERVAHPSFSVLSHWGGTYVQSEMF